MLNIGLPFSLLWSDLLLVLELWLDFELPLLFSELEFEEFDCELRLTTITTVAIFVFGRRQKMFVVTSTQ